MADGYIDLPIEGGGGGTGNILSINGSTAANQFINDGTNIDVVSGGGINTINFAGVLPITSGGTGQSNQQAALNNLTDIGSHANGDVLQLLGGNAQFTSFVAPPPTGTPNTFAGFDGAGDLYNPAGWNLDSATSFSNVGITYQPNNLAANPQAFYWNVNVDPLQNSPNDSIQLHSFNLNLDSAATGFSFGTGGDAAALLSGGMNYGGNGASFGRLRGLNLFTGLGNGTDPGSFENFSGSAISLNASANITLDGSFNGYDFNLNLNAASITGSSFNVLLFSDFSQMPVDVHGYQGVVIQPNIATIKTNSNFNGDAINPVITTMEGNSGFRAYGAFGTITNLGGGGYQGLNINPIITTQASNSTVGGVYIGSQITTMGATGASYQGLNVNPQITTSHGNISCFLASPQITGGDADVSLYQGNMNNVTGSANPSVLNLSGLTADGLQSSFGADGVRMNIGGKLEALSGQTVQSQHVIFTEYHTPAGATITGTDILMNIMSPDVDFGSLTSSVAIGPIGLGVNMVGFAGQMHGHGQMDLMSALLPTAIFAEDFTLGEWRNVNATVINGGYTGACTKATAFYHEIAGAGPFATNHWGLRVVTDMDNFVTKLAINTASQTVASANVRLQLENGHIKSSQTTAPTIVANASAGTGATASVANATDVAGQVTVVTGTIGLSTGSYATITFNQTYAVAPIVILTPASSTLSTSVYVTSTTAGFSVNFAVAGGITSTYVLNYYVIETQ